jgi:peroxiredoxin
MAESEEVAMSRIISTWFRFLLAALLILSATHVSYAQMEGGIPVGATGADVKIEPLGLAPAKLSQVAANRPILFVVFLPTCPDCQLEVPKMNAVFAKLDPKKAGMVAVGLRQGAQAVKNFQARWGVKYPLAGDTTRQVEGPYNIVAVPSFFVMDKGRVVKAAGHEANVDQLVNQLNALAAH